MPPSVPLSKANGTRLIVPGRFSCGTVGGHSAPDLILNDKHTELFHLLAQFLNVVADDAVINVHICAVIEQIQGAFDVDFQSRGNMVGFFFPCWSRALYKSSNSGIFSGQGSAKYLQ